ncbi:hypothetical protein CJ030_MR3G008563 [Morella rubra]|uniref:F-actin-capping protein subunit beta n=1 Tax=Morella rubra TaxID=262757 RepID=A0A6A1W6M3_9ROSI|nr:hypothetical protein CJ030_MR3G008563 [Morella rubra]
MEAAMGLMRRIPPKHTEAALSALLSLLPHHSSDLLSQVDQPLQVLRDMDCKKEFILCEYNRDADSYRSPWSNKYHPLLDDGTLPSLELRKLEVEANDIFAIYRDQYYEGGISSVYMWEDDNEGFVACFLIKKDGSKTGQGRRGYLQEGAWDAIHVIEVGPEEEGMAHYRLTSTVMLSLTTDNDSSGTFSLSGSIRRQMDMDLSVAEGHLCNMGRMIEEMESKLRNSLDQVYFGKTKEMLQAHFITTGQFLFCPSRTKLLELCAVSPAGDLSYATQIFHHIPNPSTNDWNAVVRGLASCPEPTKAISWYRSMSRQSGRADALTCSFALKACARMLARYEAMQIHSQTVRFGFYADFLLMTTLLDVYAKAGDLHGAEKVFDEMSVRDIASWNALVAGLAHGSQPSEAIALVNRMRLEGWKPNEITVLGALSACSQLGALKEGEKIHRYIMEEKLDMNVQVCNAVIDMYAKCGFVDKAFMVFKNMCCRKSLVTWNTMIMAFAMDGDGHKALELFKQMGQAGVHLDAVTYLAALCACNHAGLVEDGVQLFNSIARSGATHNVKHYGSVVDLLGRAGRLKEAYDIINSMPMLPDVVLWQSLLGACKTYGNVELAEIASQKLVEMGSNSCGDFVLLSNVYAAHRDGMTWVGCEQQ